MQGSHFLSHLTPEQIAHIKSLREDQVVLTPELTDRLLAIHFANATIDNMGLTPHDIEFMTQAGLNPFTDVEIVKRSLDWASPLLDLEPDQLRACITHGLSQFENPLHALRHEVLWIPI